MLRMGSIFLVYLIQIFVLDLWLREFYKRKADVKEMIACVLAISIVGTIIDKYVDFGLFKAMLGFLSQGLYGFFVFENKNWKKILAILAYYCMSNFAEITLIAIVHFAFNDSFLNLVTSPSNALFISIILALLIFIYIQIVFVVKNKFKGVVNNILLIFLCFFIGVLIMVMDFAIVSGENIYYDTFVMWIVLTICLVAVFILGTYIAYGQYKKNIEADYIKMQLSMQGDQVEKMRNHYNDLRRIRHDYNNHVATLQALLDNKEFEAAKEYTIKLGKEIKNLEGIMFCNNRAVDAVLYNKKIFANENGIDLNYKIQTSIPDTVDEMDICTLVFNLLDNAIEYSIKYNKKDVLLKIIKNKDYLVISTENHCDNFDINTSKKDKDNHGVGLKIIEAIVDKYNGNRYMGVKDGRFIHIVNLRL